MSAKKSPTLLNNMVIDCREKMGCIKPKSVIRPIWV